MKTRKFFTTVRLMTFMVAMGFLSLTTYAYSASENEANSYSGGGTEISEETVEKLDLEPWMVSDDFWSVESGVRSMSSETIALEEWMMETPFEVTAVSSGERIEMEPWMSNPYSFRTTEEQQLNRLESWMTSPSFFQTSEEQELNTIENWMLEESFWTI